MNMAIDYLPDATVDDALDRELRALLTTCFTKPQDTVFQTQRYFREPYPHRWIVRDEHARMAAHIGVHEKSVESEGQRYPIAGIAEVCVHPEHRQRGYVKAMLAHIHPWLSRHAFVFGMLFGKPAVYASSGYVSVDNLYHDADSGDERKQVKAMIKALSETPWPEAEAYLRGPKF